MRLLLKRLQDGKPDERERARRRHKQQVLRVVCVWVCLNLYKSECVDSLGRSRFKKESLAGREQINANSCICMWSEYAEGAPGFQHNCSWAGRRRPRPWVLAAPCPELHSVQTDRKTRLGEVKKEIPSRILCNFYLCGKKTNFYICHYRK